MSVIGRTEIEKIHKIMEIEDKNSYFRELIKNNHTLIFDMNVYCDYDFEQIFNDDQISFYVNASDVNGESYNQHCVFYLGRMYQFGLGVEKNIEKAIDLYEQACSLNIGIAFSSLAKMYTDGKSIKLLKKGYELNDKKSQYLLAKSYIYGHFGKKINIDKGLKLSEDIIMEINNIFVKNAFNEIIKIGKFHNRQITVDLHKYCMEQLPNKKFGYIIHEVAFMYQNGYGINKDYKKAIELYERACEFNEGIAFNNLGYMYQYGLGFNKDYGKAIELYERACEFGDGCAFRNLGYLYENGLGVGKDYGKAIELYEKSLSVKYDQLRINNLIKLSNKILLLPNENIPKIIKIYLKHNKYDLIKPIIDRCFSFAGIDNELLELILSLDLQLIYGNSVIPWSLKILQKTYNEKIDMMKLHFEYSENGRGFEEAKKDFINQINLY